MTRQSTPRRGATLALSLAAAGALVLPAPRSAAAQRAAYDSSLFAAYKWREIGPYRGGRSVAVAGSPSRPNEYYFGTTGGGVFKTTDGGANWVPVTDKYFGQTIGAIGIAPSNPDVVYVGTGEHAVRGNVSNGDGVWKTTDGGKSWQFLGLKETQFISSVIVHPTDPNTVWVGAQGNVFKANPERGVYKTTDGGKTWRKVLFRSDSAGVTEMAMDPTNPNVLYAAIWQVYRTSWMLSSGGPQSGLWKSTDGGETWTDITRNPGLPQGIWGNTGVTVSGANPNIVFALIEADSGGVYKSSDGGKTWHQTNSDRKLRQRAWYYSRIYADPRDTNLVYGLNVGIYKSTDGGKTFKGFAIPHGDNHDLWIAPNDPQRMIEANDGGATVSINGGKTWTDQDFATAQFYHVSTTNEFPYHICGAQQDNSTLCGPSRKEGGISLEDWQEAGGGESGYVTAHPLKPWVIFAGSYGGLLTRKDLRTGFERNISPWPINPMGESSQDIQHRFQWTFPIVFSPHNPNVLYVGGSELWRSTNEGESWELVNKTTKLVRADPRTMGASGGPITKDQTGVETYATIFTMAESPVKAGVLWTGSDDGLVFVSQDNGVTWKNVTPPGMGDFPRISLIEASPHAAGTAYLAANRYQLGDKSPYLYRTSDYGAHWTRIDAGIPREEFTRAIREDPVRKGLLYAGTEQGIWISFDDGASWQSLRLDLPIVPVHDMVVKEGDLVIATHGRSFYVLDDLTAIRGLSPALASQASHLFKPRDAYRVNWGGGFGGGGNGQHPVGGNPASGVTVFYTVAQPNQTVTLDFLDASGKVIKSFTSAQDSATAADSLHTESLKATKIDSLVRAGLTRDSATKIASHPVTPGEVDFEELMARGPRPQRVPNKKGLNTFSWNLRYPDASRFEGLIMWAGSTTGPVAPPGTYSVRMAVNGGAPATQTFRVLKDPRSSATLADLQEQFRYLIAVRDRLSAANDAVKKVRNVRWQVGEKEKALAGKSQAQQFRQLADDLMKQLSAAEQEIYQVRNRSSQDPLNYPIKLNNKIAALMGVAASTEARPTKQSYTTFNILSAQLDTQLVSIRKALDELLPRLNATLKDAGLSPIVPSTTEPPRQRPNVAMDD